MLTPNDHPLQRALILYRRRRFINHLLTYLLKCSSVPPLHYVTGLCAVIRECQAPEINCVCDCVYGSAVVRHYSACRNGEMVSVLASRVRGRGFNSRPIHYHAGTLYWASSSDTCASLKATFH